MDRNCRVWSLLLGLLSLANAAVGPQGGKGGPLYNQGAPNEAAVPANHLSIPGNTWKSIFALPKLWGGSWFAGQKGLARRYLLEKLEYPPFKPEPLAQSRAMVQRIIDGKADFLDSSCRPWGMPRLIYYAGALTFMEQPGLVVLFTQQPREIFVDGRGHPKDLTDPDALVQLTTIGHSIGHWERGTLVVDTVGIDPKVQIYYGVANGGGMHIIERYRLLGPNQLELRMTVDAPEVLTRPWEYVETYQRLPEPSVLGDECDPGVVREQVDEQGTLKLDLAPRE